MNINEYEDWVVVYSKNGKTKDGSPAGEIICRNLQETKDAIKEMSYPMVKTICKKGNKSDSA